MNDHEEVLKRAVQNYSKTTPWPSEDNWHSYTFMSEKQIVEKWLTLFSNQNDTILNAGSGGTTYDIGAKWIHMDIIESYISQFNNYLVGSIEKIDLPNSSIDGIVCVGSVLNYVDAQNAIGEFSRILKPGGFLIIEFERSDSAEFLCTKQHGKYIFKKDYLYNGQTHLLWMYSEKHIRQLLHQYSIKISRCSRIHCFSSLLFRIGVSEEHAAPFSKYDKLLQCFSYPLAHNVLLFGRKTDVSCRNN